MREADARLYSGVTLKRPFGPHDALLVSPELHRVLWTVQVAPEIPYTVAEWLRKFLPHIRVGVDGLDDAQIETEANFPPWSAFTVIGIRNGRAVAKYVIP